MTARRIAGVLSVVSLGLGLILSLFRSTGRLSASDFKTGFLFASLAYFIFLIAATFSPRKSRPGRTSMRRRADSPGDGGPRDEPPVGTRPDH